MSRERSSKSDGFKEFTKNLKDKKKAPEPKRPTAKITASMNSTGIWSFTVSVTAKVASQKEANDILGEIMEATGQKVLPLE